METEVVLISNFLRNEGMQVSIRSTTLAYTVLMNLKDSLTEDELYHCLKAIYVKDIADNDKFKRAFNKVFKKLDLKKEKQEQQPQQDMVKGGEDLSQPKFNPNDNLEQLQELYDQMIEDKKNNREKDGKLVDVSMVLLDTYDPRVFELCKKLGKKIANQRSQRLKMKKSRHIDMPRTIRSNLKNGGHCIKLIHSKPPMKKNKHIFLCDVSGSCEWITSWFFLLLYGCKQTFNKVKIYDFDNKLTDVTDVLGTESFSNIGQVNIAQREKGIHCYGQSDMAKAFKEFLKTAEINHRTDIIILTDCRDWKGERKNGVLESASLIKEMLKRAHRVIILNPEKKIRWTMATSCVKDYEDAGAEVFETSDLNMFEKVISEL